MYCRSKSIRKVIILFISVYFLLSSEIQSINNSITKISNEEIEIELIVNKNNVPCISNVYWKNDNSIAFSNEFNNQRLSDWLPETLIKRDSNINKSKIISWNYASREGLTIATAQKKVKDLIITWCIELPEYGTMFNMYVKLENKSNENTKINWFPIWNFNINSKSITNVYLKYWQPLSYQPNKVKLINNIEKKLYSKLYSSDDDDGKSSLPYWIIDNELSTLSFALSWSGGWNASIKKEVEIINLSIKLPPEETQLKLKPNETINGPVLNIFIDKSKNNVIRRKKWLDNRNRISNILYKKPNNWSPLVYNNWYATRFDLTGDYIKNQIREMKDYNYDIFIVDAGWYNGIGDWTSNRRLFNSGEFENYLRNIKANKTSIGLWSCPWLIESTYCKNKLNDKSYYNRFMKSHALELPDINFSNMLVTHIQNLKKDFNIEWWKYDQEFLGENTTNGKMKNIIELQNSLSFVRTNYPDLNIENCMSGGRMINEFTDQIAQSHWIRDGSNTGIDHANANFLEALGAIQFITPLKVQRWMNRFNETDENNSELLKLYCRSTMVGTWGISTDLSKVSKKQKDIVLKEIDNYRKMAKYKSSNLFDIFYPEESDSLAGVVYYDEKQENAVVLFIRWNCDEVINHQLELNYLKDNTYTTLNTDTQEIKNIENRKMNIVMKKNQLSVLYFINIDK